MVLHDMIRHCRLFKLYSSTLHELNLQLLYLKILAPNFAPFTDHYSNLPRGRTVNNSN